MFIYKITNIKNNKVYIGQTIRPIEQRFKRHISDAMNNILDTHFARAIRKYGESCFRIELVDTAASQNELNIKEQKYIQQYNSIIDGYNETDAISKCGGNTYMSKNKDEMLTICDKIRVSKIGTKNPNHKAIKVRNEETKQEIYFDTVLDCQKYFNEKHHRFITTRTKGQTRSLYKKTWNIAYTDNDYNDLTKDIVRKGHRITVTNLCDGSVISFKSVRNMCKTLGIDRNYVRNKENKIIGSYSIVFE